MPRALPLVVGFFVVVLFASQSSVAQRSSSLPTLSREGIGSVHIGASKADAIAVLRTALGQPNTEGVNKGCGAKFTEVAWHDLIVEFRAGRFSGYRFMEGGRPLATYGGLHDRITTKAPTPLLKTAAGITLGSTLGELRSAYRDLRLSGAVQWTAQDGLTFVEPSTAANPRVASDRIAEIKVGTCGAF